jgi:hypothetical protein
MLGLKCLEDSVTVVVAVNCQPLCASDCKHGYCMQYVILERGPGGTKGLSRTPRLTYSYCRPIQCSHFPKEEAGNPLLEFRRLVEAGLWSAKSDSDHERGVDSRRVVHQQEVKRWIPVNVMYPSMTIRGVQSQARILTTSPLGSIQRGVIHQQAVVRSPALALPMAKIVKRMWI